MKIAKSEDLLIAATAINNALPVGLIDPLVIVASAVSSVVSKWVGVLSAIFYYEVGLFYLPIFSANFVIKSCEPEGPHQPMSRKIIPAT